MTKLNRRRAPGAASIDADLVVDPREAPGSYLKNDDGSFTRTDDAPGEPAATAVNLPAASAQGMLDAFAALGVEPPEHLVAAAGAAADADAVDEPPAGDPPLSSPPNPEPNA